jgi:hypothetical protein
MSGTDPMIRQRNEPRKTMERCRRLIVCPTIHAPVSHARGDTIHTRCPLPSMASLGVAHAVTALAQQSGAAETKLSERPQT